MSVPTKAIPVLLTPLALLISQQAYADDTVPPERVERIAITGSHIKRVNTENATPVYQLSAEDIAVSGKISLTEVLRDLTINAGNSYDEQYTSSFSAGSASIALRGLSPKNTLLLVNGQRVSNNGFALNTQDTFVDLNALPLSAVERIEILKDGASAVYGSDAIAGVVNIILRKNYQDTELKLSGGNATEGDLEQYAAGLVTGIGDLQQDGYNLTASFDFLKRERLDASDRKLTRSGDFRHLPGGKLAGWSSQGGGYVYSAQNRVAFDNCPLGSDKRPWADFDSPLAGDTCAFNAQPFNTLQPEITRRQFSLLGTVQLNDNLQGHAEVLYSNNDSAQIFGAPLSIGAGLRAYDQASGTLIDIPVVLPVDHPDNPTSSPLAFEYTFFDLGPRLKNNQQQFSRILAGLNYGGEHWDWQFTALTSESRQREYVDNFVNRYAFEQALADGSYRFTEGGNSADVIDALRLQTRRPGDYRIDSLNFSASRILAELPAGPLAFAAGVDLRREKMQAGTSYEVLSGTELRPAINLVDGKREVIAAFTEFTIPLLTDLTLSAAGRADHYDDFGSAFSPKIGAHYVLNDDWLLRASWSRGFRAPSLPEISDSNTVSYSSVIDPYDPITPGSSRGFSQFRAGNPDLKAERSTNINAGVIWSVGRHSSIGIDAFRIEQQDVIASDNAQFIINNPQLYPDRIRRDEQGRLQIITNQYRNQGVREVSGFDLDFNHRWQLGEGQQLSLNSVWSRLISYKQSLVAGQPSINGAGSNQFGALPQWQSNTSLNWQYSDWQATLGAEYTSSYEQKVATAASNPGLNSKVDSHLQFNTQLSYGGFANTVLALSVNNLTDRDPPFDPAAGSYYYDMTQYNVRGRVLNLSVSYKL
ncbi:iron complex outermembrane recepter protein [Rheinheimera pacifica]|uniref:Iron complex outermembrane recepter protein n=1 Tax=Rheinheimera pacifica TaxID=173990 RepID=A0A1H6JB82_9GAMM|nr:TonB-dependent receptor [Rheinheimera pacifica]SEH56274.1 iron complex outermembrane recepter protein [Rheinheimera pacifica]